MYEVFLNDRKIILADGHEPAFHNSGLSSVILVDQESLAGEIRKFLSSEENGLVLTGRIEWLWPSFQAFFKLIPAAGGVVSSEKGTLFIYRRDYWDLPKGKTDPHESSEEAALREVREETGLVTLTITGTLPSTWHIYRPPYEKSLDKWILKETKWYAMQANGSQPLMPETGEDIVEARWFTKAETGDIISSVHRSLYRIIETLQ